MHNSSFYSNSCTHIFMLQILKTYLRNFKRRHKSFIIYIEIFCTFNNDLKLDVNNILDEIFNKPRRLEFFL